MRAKTQEQEGPVLCITGRKGTGKTRLAGLLRDGGYTGTIITTNERWTQKTIRLPYSKRAVPIVYLEIAGLQ